MTPPEIATFNAAWLQAWTDKDIPRLIGFYAEDCVYKDAQTAAGLEGRAALAGLPGRPVRRHPADDLHARRGLADAGWLLRALVLQDGR